MSFVLLFTLLTSCNSDDEIIEKKPKEEDIHWGYFKGSINDKSYSIENVGYPEKTGYPYNPVYSNLKHIDLVNGYESRPITTVPTSIEFEENATMIIKLVDIYPGIRYIKNSYEGNWMDNLINIYYSEILEDGSQKLETRYIVSESNPVMAEMLYVYWTNYHTTLMEVKINGVVYNEENPNDSIIFSGIYGTR